MLRTAINIRLVLCFTAATIAACSGQKTGTASSAIRGEIDLERVLSWLPADTETLLVANGPFWMSNFQAGQDYKNREITTEELEKQFEGLTLGLFNSGKGLLQKHLKGTKVLFALEGSRHFRPPAGLGELPFEGCALALLEDDLNVHRDAFMKDASQVAARFEEIEGQKVAVFEEPMELDVWTIFITFPQKGVVLVATNKKFLQEMLARMGGSGGARALPDSLREWTYVNKQVKFWGLRHYDKQQSKHDPTSPFGGKKSANIPDDEAIGLTYQSNPSKELKATLTYLSGAKAEVGNIEKNRFPRSGEPDQTPGLHVQYRELEPGVIQSTYDLSHSQPLDWFFFVFMGSLGHAVYI